MKTCFAFHFPEIETLFLEYSKSVKMIWKSQIYSLKITVSLQIKLSFQTNKLGQIYVQWDNFVILRYVSACSVGRKTYCPNSILCTGALTPPSTWECISVMRMKKKTTMSCCPGWLGLSPRRPAAQAGWSHHRLCTAGHHLGTREFSPREYP